MSEVAQKNFRRFTLRVNEHKAMLPDEKYYQNLVAKAILFRRTEKLVQQQQYGGYRANIVTYTLAYLSYKTAQRIDLGKIWKDQALSENLERAIVDVSAIVRDVIINPPGGANVGEWCKKEKCWNTVKECVYVIPEALQAELVEVGYVLAKPTPTSSIESLTEDDQKIIEQAAAVSPEIWFALSRWSKETNNFQPWLRSMLFSVGTLVGRGRKPSIKQSRHAMKALEDAKTKGFVAE